MAPSMKIRDIDWSRWSPTERATLLFVVRDGKVLLIHKKKGLGAGKINGPGGRIEPGETPKQAAIREVQEELGVTPLNVEPRGELRFQFVDGFSIHGYVFIADDCDAAPHETDEAIPIWTPLDQIPYERMWADDRIWLPLMLEGRTFSGRFIFDDDRMLDHEVTADPT
ncbi:MAG: 8-oxo-dGTP diphosphatase [Kiritimatiellae bacterium]|nr:8-oxo-dGTP diphosphatase [Kiritimatiellia bacterium]